MAWGGRASVWVMLSTYCWMEVARGREEEYDGGVFEYVCGVVGGGVECGSGVECGVMGDASVLSDYWV
eukprot:12172998-Alexandrium_andersonii.AAC.1